MAQVTLTVVVDDSQVNALQQKVSQINGTRINLHTGNVSQEVRDVSGNLSKIERVFDKDGNLVKGVDQFQSGVAETVTVTQKLSKETGGLETVSTKYVRNIAKEQKVAQQETEQETENIKEQGRQTEQLHKKSLTSFMGRVLVYRALYAAISTVTNAFKTAINTIHKVDDEMVTVRKVTGFTAEQMESIQEQAFKTATKYGSSADEYLSGVAAFARAGYKELAADLAELSTKTQIVGDTTADVANQFLLSVDAAYKYKGSVEALSRVLDGANELDNKYATSIEKIAEGMGIVAPVAAQMHVGVDELAASIGTITAVTQRSGTEAARALRAIFLNIVGDTKTEIEEGVTWTTGEIAGLKDVIRQYASEAYKAAEATGAVIDPMEAIRGLAKSMEEGVLTEQKLMEMVSDIGGKLRTSQLLAIIQNWDMYESMLQDYRNAYGSADKEIENAMDSWTRKANVLKNTWTEFVQRTINAEGMKNFLDILTAVVARLDTIPGVLARLTLLIVGLKLPSIISAVQRIGTSIKTMNAGLESTSIILIAISIAWSAISYAINDYKIKTDKAIQAQKEALSTSKESISANLDRIAGLEELRQKYLLIIDSTMTEQEKDQSLTSIKQELIDTYGLEEDALAGVNKEREKGLGLIDAETQKEVERALAEGAAAYNAAQRAIGNRNRARRNEIFGGSGEASMAQTYGDILAQYGAEGTDYFVGTGASTANKYASLEIAGDMDQQIAFLEKVINGIQKKILRGEATNAEQSLLEIASRELQELFAVINENQPVIDSYNELLARNELYQRGFSNATIQSKDDLEAYKNQLRETYDGDEAILEIMLRLIDEAYPQFTDATEKETAATKEETAELYANQKALDANASATDRAAAAKKDAEAAASRFAKVMFDETGAITLAARAALEADSNLAGLVKSELEAELAAKQANYSALIAQLATIGNAAGYAAQQLYSMFQAAAGESPVGNLASGGALGATLGAFGGNSVQALLYAKQNEIQQLMAQISGVGVYAGGSSSGGHSGGGSGGSHSSSSASTEDKKLTALKNRITLLKSELSLMKERGDSEEDLIAKMREIQNALHAQAEYLRSIKGDQAEINGLSEEWWSLENQITQEKEKQAKAIQDALDAQLALNNAMNDRSVRYYNAETGQWEWGANQENVNSAYEALQNAIEAAGFGSMDEWAMYYATQQALSGGGTKGLPFSGSGLRGIGAGSPITRGGVNNSYVGGTNNYGNTYQIGNLTFSEQQAKTITLYDLAQISRNLSLYNSVY